MVVADQLLQSSIKPAPFSSIAQKHGWPRSAHFLWQKLLTCLNQPDHFTIEFFQDIFTELASLLLYTMMQKRQTDQNSNQGAMPETSELQTRIYVAFNSELTSIVTKPHKQTHTHARLSKSLAIGKSFSLVLWSLVDMVTAQANVVILLSLHPQARTNLIISFAIWSSL